MTTRRPLKTGAGRPAAAPAKVSPVESIQCPERTPGGNHWLTNRGPITLCRFCLSDWSTLDSEARAS